MTPPRVVKSVPAWLACAILVVLVVACSSSGGAGSGDASSPDTTAPRVDGSASHRDAADARPPTLGGDATQPTGPLEIGPTGQTLVVPHGKHAPTLGFTATEGGHAVSASFSIDKGQVGTINAGTGVLTPSGSVGGIVTVTATFEGKSASTTVTVKVQLQQNGAPGVSDGGTPGDAGSGLGGVGGVGGSGPGGSVSATIKSILQGKATPDKGLAWLYPYDKTVWPQGLLAPLLQWQPGAVGNYDGVYIHLQEKCFEYEGFFAPPAKLFINHPILQTAWDTMSYSNQGSTDPVTVTLVFASGSKAYGPLTETWTIAQGTLTGTVYYNSYGTALAINYANTTPGYPNFGGATLAIKRGATGPVLVAGASGDSSQCRVCHSVAAGGSHLLTQHGDNYNETSSYDLTTSGYTETVMPTGTGEFAFPAIFPDGTFLLTNTGGLPGVGPPATSTLFSIPAGAAITAHGLPDGGVSAATPSFSPNGKHVAFNDYGIDQASLAAMDFANASKTFSNLRTLHKPAGGTRAVFPAFLPTNDATIFERELAGGFGSTWQGARGELWWVDLSTHKAAPLSTLNGTGYLPTGPHNHGSDDPDGAPLENDTTLQYEPTVNPVASGGYAWVVFTSRRLYGNVATQEPFLSDPRNYNASLSATTKKLWVAAIDLGATPGTDPSHPAFYLPGQELLACNSRGYWVVDPCEPNGQACLTGDQCCSGYCEAVDGGSVCGTPPKGCSSTGNKCATTADCCGATSGIECIDGFCSIPSPP
jgi:hypothetical protein